MITPQDPAADLPEHRRLLAAIRAERRAFGQLAPRSIWSLSAGLALRLTGAGDALGVEAVPAAGPARVTVEPAS